MNGKGGSRDGPLSFFAYMLVIVLVVNKKQGEKTAPGAAVFSPCVWVRIVGPALGPAAQHGPFLVRQKFF